MAEGTGPEFHAAVHKTNNDVLSQELGHLGDLYAENGQTLQGSFSAAAAAVDRLYRSQILRVNTRRKALAEIYTMHSFAPFSNLNFFVKHC